MANYIKKESLLKDKRVVEEIDRHLWLESEKTGKDVGLKYAREDWLKNFSKAWMGYHMPNVSLKLKKAIAEKKVATKKRRSAKSYLK